MMGAGMYGPVKPTPVKYPFIACLQGNKGDSLCGDPLGSSDFRFTDVEYAAKNYSDDPHLRVCSACMAIVRKMGAK